MSGPLSSVIVKLVERCNLKCSYCYLYEHGDTGYLARPKAMDEEVFHFAVGRLREYCATHAPHRVSITLHGGEPTLRGSQAVDRMCAYAQRELGDSLSYIALQTNGTLLDDDWIDVIKRNRLIVGVSLDGPPDIHDRRRVNHAGLGSYADVLAGIATLRKHHCAFGVLCVIQPGASGLAVYRHFRALGIANLTFLLPDATHDSKRLFFPTTSDTPIADYLIPVFDSWYDEDDPCIKIGVFRTLLRLMMGGSSDNDLFGNPALNYLVVETDGSILGLDTLRICGEHLDYTGLNVRTDNFDALERAAPRLYQFMSEGTALCGKCLACPHVGVCGGGYLPHRHARANGFANPSIWCEDILRLLDHMYERTGLPRSAASVC